MKVQTPVLFFALAAVAGAAIAQDPAQPRTQPHTQGAAQDAKITQMLVPSGDLLGLTAKNSADKDLGSLNDVIVDPRTGEFRYAIVDVGGFLGIGATERILPWSAFDVRVDPEDKDEWVLRAELTEAQVKAAPECKDDTKFDADLDRRIGAAFRTENGNAEANATQPAMGKTQWARVSKLADDVDLMDSAGRKAGEVEGLVLAPEHDTVAFAVVQANDEAGGKRIAVPMASLHFAYAPTDDADEKGELRATAKVEMARFATAPEYDSDNLDRMGSTTWLDGLCKHYGCEPFWKRSVAASAPKTRPTEQ
ncbi:MAG: hypothetical protein GC161_02610 [Planctomycetaceae bacterium]|nr:hypothetical protein [Planctomycetaceae bacterium]